MKVIIRPDAPVAVTVGQDKVVAVNLPQQGPAGPPAPPITLTAGQDLSAERVVAVNASALAVYADPANPDHATAVVGITTAAALSGQAVRVATFGALEANYWSWTPGAALYLVAGGHLGETPDPGAAFVLEVAQAVSPTKVLIKPFSSILTA